MTAVNTGFQMPRIQSGSAVPVPTSMPSPSVPVKSIDNLPSSAFDSPDVQFVGQVENPDAVLRAAYEEAKRIEEQERSRQASMPSPYPVPPASAAPSSVPSLTFPSIPATSGAGKPELCLVVLSSGQAHFSPVFYGTEEEREKVRRTYMDFAETIQARYLTFFVATSVYHRPPEKLKPMDELGSSEQNRTNGSFES